MIRSETLTDEALDMLRNRCIGGSLTLPSDSCRRGLESAAQLSGVYTELDRRIELQITSELPTVLKDVQSPLGDLARTGLAYLAEGGFHDALLQGALLRSHLQTFCEVSQEPEKTGRGTVAGMSSETADAASDLMLLCYLLTQPYHLQLTIEDVGEEGLQVSFRIDLPAMRRHAELVSSKLGKLADTQEHSLEVECKGGPSVSPFRFRGFLKEMSDSFSLPRETSSCDLCFYRGPQLLGVWCVCREGKEGGWQLTRR